MLWQLILAGIMLGIGLAMDAFAVSLTDGLNEPQMRHSKAVFIALTFALFQAVMPMIGWLCVTLIAERFAVFAEWVPYIALVLLVIIGGKMLFDGIKPTRHAKYGNIDAEQPSVENTAKSLTLATLFAQAVATSIDALSTGFTLNDIAGNVWWQALVAVSIIGIMTFAISITGIFVGKKFGDKLGSKAETVGGVILIAIGIEIFVTGVFF